MHILPKTKSPKCVGNYGAMNYHLNQQIPNPNLNQIFHYSIIMKVMPSCPLCYAKT